MFCPQNRQFCWPRKYLMTSRSNVRRRND